MDSLERCALFIFYKFFDVLALDKIFIALFLSKSNSTLYKHQAPDDEAPFVGTCQKLEKSYFRLSGELRPDGRREHGLELRGRERVLVKAAEELAEALHAHLAQILELVDAERLQLWRGK